MSNLETGNIFSVDFSSASCGSINLVHGNRLKVTGCRLAGADARNKFYKLLGSIVWYWLSSINFVIMLIKYHWIGYLLRLMIGINLVHGNRLKVTGCRLAGADARNKFYKLLGSIVWYWLSSINFVIMLIKYHWIGYLLRLMIGINLVHGNRLKVTGCRLAGADARNKFYKLLGSIVWYWLSSIYFVIMLIKYRCLFTKINDWYQPGAWQ